MTTMSSIKVNAEGFFMPLILYKKIRAIGSLTKFQTSNKQIRILRLLRITRKGIFLIRPTTESLELVAP
jgi:hypothetical protein